MAPPDSVTLVIRDPPTTFLGFVEWARTHYGKDIADSALAKVISEDDGSGGLREKVQSALGES